MLFEGGNHIGEGVPPWGGGFGSWSVSMPALHPTPDAITSSIHPLQLLDSQGVVGVIEDWPTDDVRYVLTHTAISTPDCSPETGLGVKLGKFTPSPTPTPDPLHELHGTPYPT